MNEPNLTRRSGVTLIEMLVVVVIIAVFAAVVGPRLLNQGDKGARGRRPAADREFSACAGPVSSRHRRLSLNRSGPAGPPHATVRRRAVHGPYLAKDVANDPWGHAYVYKFPGEHGDEPDVISYGADGQAGGEGLNADIQSWK